MDATRRDKDWEGRGKRIKAETKQLGVRGGRQGGGREQKTGKEGMFLLVVKKQGGQHTQKARELRNQERPKGHPKRVHFRS